MSGVRAQEIDSLFKQLQEHGEASALYGPQSESSVRELERLLGFSLPSSYRAYLLRYGGGYGGIFGLYADQPEMTNAGCLYGEVTKAREQFGLAPHLLPIRGSAFDGYYCLDLTEHGDNPAVVFCRSHDLRAGALVQPVADSFESLLIDLLENELTDTSE